MSYSNDFHTVNKNNKFISFFLKSPLLFYFTAVFPFHALFNSTDHFSINPTLEGNHFIIKGEAIEIAIIFIIEQKSYKTILVKFINSYIEYNLEIVLNS